MVMKPEPLYDLYDDLISKGKKPYVIYASPQGRVFHSEIAHELAKKDELLFICGRYEGIDERCMKIVDDEISIGDYVTSGAEFPVLVMIDSISRFCPGVVGNYDSVINDSHYQGLLDHENYTRPAEYRGMKVPEVYLNGNHKLIDEARLENSLLRTAVKRPDLFSKKEFSVEEKRALAKLILELYQDVGLIHYPCLGKNNQIISTAVTNIDIHDIARTCRTYNIKKYFMVTNLPAQQEIIRRVLKFWIDGSGRRFNENRTEALYEVDLKAYYEDVIEAITQKEGEKPLTVFTSARIRPNTITFDGMRQEIYSQQKPILLIFGTGHGLPNEILSTCDYSLEPVRASGDFNHLSVRSAIAIILDRLIGETIA